MRQADLGQLRQQRRQIEQLGAFMFGPDWK
jgi:hypothetical protein